MVTNRSGITVGWRAESALETQWDTARHSSEPTTCISFLHQLVLWIGSWHWEEVIVSHNLPLQVMKSKDSQVFLTEDADIFRAHTAYPVWSPVFTSLMCPHPPGFRCPWSFGQMLSYEPHHWLFIPHHHRIF